MWQASSGMGVSVMDRILFTSSKCLEGRLMEERLMKMTRILGEVPYLTFTLNSEGLGVFCGVLCGSSPFLQGLVVNEMSLSDVA